MILKILRTLVSYTLFLLLLAIVIIPTLLFLLFPARWRYDNKLFFWLAHFFYKASLWLTFLPIQFIGKGNILKKPSIIVANHQSSLDIALVGILLNAHSYIWMAWHELKKTWVGLVVSRMAILIDTSTPMKGMRSLVQAINMCKGKKQHIIIFPEGGRYTDGKVHDFFSGFVILSKKTERPVVPIAIINAYKAYPPNAFLINWYPIKVVVGKPFYYEEGESDNAFKERVRSWFVDQVHEG